MATLLQNDQEKDKQPGATPGQAPTAAPASPMAQGAPTPQQPQKPKGTGFTNVSSYINANKGAGQKLAQGVQQNVGQEAEKLNTSISEADKIKQGIGAEQARLGQAGQVAQTLQTGGVEDIKNNLAQAQQLYQGQSNRADLEAQAQQNLQQNRQNLQNVQGLAQQASTEGGRFDLLRRTFNRPGYSQGAQRLDQLLVQGDGSNTLGQLQRNLAGTAAQGQQKYQGLETDLTSGLTDIEKQRVAAQQQIQSTLGEFGKDKGGVLGSEFSALSKAEADAEAKRKAFLEGAKANLAKGEISEEEAQALGLSDGMAIGDLDLAGFAQNIKGNTDLSMADVAKQEQIARLNALRQVAGLGDVDLGKTTDQSVQFDKKAFEDAAKQRMSEVNKQFLEHRFDTRGSELTGNYNQAMDAVKLDIANFSNQFNTLDTQIKKFNRPELHQEEYNKLIERRNLAKQNLDRANLVNQEISKQSRPGNIHDDFRFGEAQGLLTSNLTGGANRDISLADIMRSAVLQRTGNQAEAEGIANQYNLAKKYIDETRSLQRTGTAAPKASGGWVSGSGNWYDGMDYSKAFDTIASRQDSNQAVTKANQEFKQLRQQLGLDRTLKVKKNTPAGGQ